MNAVTLITTLLQIAGSLCFLLYGMKLMSDGIQKSAGQKLEVALNFMTGNRLTGLLTGCLLTMLIQSSGATTVMVVSFVNASLISLSQSIAVIFGANIGTTVTAWIVALFGFNFKISAFAIPIFAIGYLLVIIKKWNKGGIGQAIMGFAMLFIALSWLSDSISLSADSMSFLPAMQAIGIWSIPLGAMLGILVTALIHSSSAMTAIVITMAYNHLLQWEFSAAIIIGSNIGSTVDSIMAAVGGTVNAKRTAGVHVLFNVVTALLALIFIHPLTLFVDFIVPGNVQDNVTYHIAMLHTLFNVAGTVLFLPFSSYIAKLLEHLIKEQKGELPSVYKFEFSELEAKESTAIPIVKARTQVTHMADIAVQMFDRLQYGFMDRSGRFVVDHYEKLVKEEDYLDQMQEQLTSYLLRCEHMDVDEATLHNLTVMLSIVNELEDMSDNCCNIGHSIKKMTDKQYVFPKEDFERLLPYLELARQFLQFIYRNLNKPLTKDQMDFADELENQIDAERKDLKKLGRKRLEQGANVKAELLYIDIAKQIEKIGDCCFNIAEQLVMTK